MRALGIRASDQNVIFSVVEEETSRRFNILNIEDIKLPAALELPQQLKYLRSVILDIIREYSIEKAGIRVVENISDNKSTKRIQIEGVIQEAFASSSVRSYFVGQNNTITARLRPNLEGKTQFKDFIKSQSKCEFVVNWEECTNNEKKESVLVAVGALA